MATLLKPVLLTSALWKLKKCIRNCLLTPILKLLILFELFTKIRLKINPDCRRKYVAIMLLDKQETFSRFWSFFFCSRHTTHAPHANLLSTERFCVIFESKYTKINCEKIPNYKNECTHTHPH